MAENLAYPLHWPGGWPRTRYRQSAKFSKKVDNGRYQESKQLTIADALKRLQSELDLLGARDEILSSNLQRNLDGSPKSNQAEPADRGVAIYFKLRGEPMALACDKWDRCADNIAALAAHIGALRGMERWGVGTTKQVFAGYQALPAPEQWWNVLGVKSSATVPEINAAFREKAASAHPDKGGSDAAMARLIRARDDGLAIHGVSAARALT